MRLILLAVVGAVLALGMVLFLQRNADPIAPTKSTNAMEERFAADEAARSAASTDGSPKPDEAHFNAGLGDLQAEIGTLESDDLAQAYDDNTAELARTMLGASLEKAFPGAALSPEALERLTAATLRLRSAKERLREAETQAGSAELRESLINEIDAAVLEISDVMEEGLDATVPEPSDSL